MKWICCFFLHAITRFEIRTDFCLKIQFSWFTLHTSQTHARAFHHFDSLLHMWNSMAFAVSEASWYYHWNVTISSFCNEMKQQRNSEMLIPPKTRYLEAQLQCFSTMTWKVSAQLHKEDNFYYIWLNSMMMNCKCSRDMKVGGIQRRRKKVPRCSCFV